MCSGTAVAPWRAPLLIKPSHMGVHMELRFHPPCSPRRACVCSGTVRFSRSLCAAARVTRSFGVLMSISFTAVLLNSSVSSVCLKGLYTDSVGKPWRRIRWHTNTFATVRLPTVLPLRGPQLEVLWYRMRELRDAQSISASSTSLSSSSLVFQLFFFFLCRSVSRHHFLHRLHRNLISLKRTHTHTDSLLCTCTQSQADIQIGPDTHLHMQTHIIQLMSVSVRASG